MRIIFALMFATMFVGVANSETVQPWQARALKMVKAEKQVLDARWKSPSVNMLHVAMQPDGGSRNGFAEYLCMMFKQAGGPDGLKSVYIYDPATYNAYKNGGSGSDIGLAACR